MGVVSHGLPRNACFSRDRSGVGVAAARVGARGCRPTGVLWFDHDANVCSFPPHKLGGPPVNAPAKTARLTEARPCRGGRGPRPALRLVPRPSPEPRPPARSRRRPAERIAGQVAALAMGLTLGALAAGLVTLPFSVADAAASLRVAAGTGVVAGIALMRARAAVRARESQRPSGKDRPAWPADTALRREDQASGQAGGGCSDGRRPAQAEADVSDPPSPTGRPVLSQALSDPER
jgi:hypothetical protein